jgi:hypothetical protein
MLVMDLRQGTFTPWMSVRITFSGLIVGADLQGRTSLYASGACPRVNHT